ncbi:hypothetical protein LPJ59_001306 [Coemansia sp. RSA 2399]|nr:hypothetical protein LPJ59_001306 [Coemansia sp. RSA 2399]
MQGRVPAENVVKIEAETSNDNDSNSVGSKGTSRLSRSTSVGSCLAASAMRATLTMPTAPQRAAFRSAGGGAFHTTSTGSAAYARNVHSERRNQSQEISESSLLAPATTQQDNTEVLGSEWASERMDELSLEIQKLINDPQAADQNTSNGDSGQSSAHLAARSPHKRVPSMPESSSRSVLEGLSISQQPLNLYKVPDGIMQVFVMGVHPSNPINRAYVVVRLGDQVFQTSVSKTPTSNWNEGFELIVSYHMQLFGTVHLDVYSSNLLLPDTHVGRAEIKLSLLDGFPEIFTSYYEIWDKKMTASTVPDQKQREIVSKNLGALQVRLNYRYQKLEDPEPRVAKSRGVHISGTVPNQMVNQMAESQMGASASIDMPIEDLVAGFANEFNKYMEMAHIHGRKAFVRTATATDSAGASDGAGDSGSKPDDAGFAKVDDDTARPEDMVGGSGTQDAEAPKGSSSTRWFSDLFSGLAPTSAAATTTASGASSDSDSASKTSSKAEQKEAAQSATDRTLVQSLTSMFISSSVFMVVKSLDRLIDTFNQGIELSNTELLGGLLTLYKFYSEADIPGVTRPHKGQIIDRVEQLQVPGHYARYALATYGWRALYFFNRGITLMDGAKIDSDVTSVLQYLNMAPEDLLGYEFRSSQLFCPSYFIAHDRQHDAVVLSVRGTMSAEDTVVDLSCEYTKWNGGLVHSGMQASAHWLFVKVVPRILAYARSQGIRRIRIVGHSLGGSTAAILMIMVRSVRDRLCGLGVDIDDYDIRAYCFGPAPCISDNIADRFRDCIETYVNRDDLVPRLCYGTVSDFKRISISAADEADNLAQRLYAPFEDTVLQQRRWKEKFARLMSIRKDIVATQENLHLALPGTIHHIVSYRGGASGKDKRAPRDPELDVTFGKHELFGDAHTEDGAGTLSGKPNPSGATPLGADSGDEQESGSHDGATPVVQPPPPPSPETQVQQDCVDPAELADAINTPIDKDATLQGPKQPSTRESKAADGGAGMRDPATAAGSSASSDKFYPVWVQSVPNNSFREIVLRSTLVTDHMPSAYELAFAHAIETQMHERRLMNRRKWKPSDEATNSKTSTSEGDKGG